MSSNELITKPSICGRNSVAHWWSHSSRKFEALIVQAVVVRDTLWISGGVLWWQPGWKNGLYGPAIADGKPPGLVYSLNFTSPFDVSLNISRMFSTTSEMAVAGANVSLTLSGSLLSNYDDFVAFGGVTFFSTVSQFPVGSNGASTTTSYEIYGDGISQFTPGFVLEVLPSAITAYISDGGSVSVPSENLAFIFSGLRAASFDEIFYLKNESTNPDVPSSTLIQLNTTSDKHHIWSNHSLSPSVIPRASAQMVYIPVAENGILIAVGGVINLAFANLNQSYDIQVAQDSVNLLFHQSSTTSSANMI